MSITMELPAGGDGEEPLRVLVIDHVGVLRSIRDRYVRLARQANVEITLLSPTIWNEACSPVPYQEREGEPFETILGRVSWPGHEIRSVFLTGIIEAFKRSRPHVIVMMEEAFSLFALQTLALRKIFAPSAPVLFYTCFITSYERDLYRPKWLFRALFKFVVKRTAIGLCINEKAVRALRDARFYNARSLFFGVNEDIFQPVDRRAARAAVGIDDDVDLFLYAGRLLELKGIQDLVEAFARLCAERPDRNLRLKIVGNGEYGEALRRQVAELRVDDVVDFHSYVPLDEVRQYMGAATAFVLPSRAEWCEQFGRVIAEAMLTETTVIGSTSGEIPRAIGEAGFIFPAGDIDALKKVMTYVLDDPEEAERRKHLGREKALREYSYDAFVSGLIDALETVSERSLRQQVYSE